MSLRIPTPLPGGKRAVAPPRSGRGRHEPAPPSSRSSFGLTTCVAFQLFPNAFSSSTTTAATGQAAARPARRRRLYVIRSPGHTAATGVTREGALAPIQDTASNGPSANGDDGRHVSTTVHLHPPAATTTPADGDPYPADARRDPVFVFHGSATQWCMISKTAIQRPGNAPLYTSR